MSSSSTGGRTDVRSTLLVLLGVVILVALWTIGGRAGWAKGMVVTPLEATGPLRDERSREVYLRAVAATAGAAARGLVIGAVIGIAGAMVASVIPATRRVVTRLAALSNATPWVVVGPLLLIVLGRSRGPVGLAAIAALFPVFVSTYLGLVSTPAGGLDVVARPRRVTTRRVARGSASRRPSPRRSTGCASRVRPHWPVPSSVSGTGHRAGSVCCSSRQCRTRGPTGCGRPRCLLSPSRRSCTRCSVSWRRWSPGASVRRPQPRRCPAARSRRGDWSSTPPARSCSRSCWWRSGGAGSSSATSRRSCSRARHASPTTSSTTPARTPSRPGTRSQRRGSRCSSARASACWPPWPPACRA